jgi:hypothetical protein
MEKKIMNISLTEASISIGPKNLGLVQKNISERNLR